MAYSKNPARENTNKILYIEGDETTEDSKRFAIDSETGYTEIEVLQSGIWQPATLEVGSNTLWIGKNVGLSAIGSHLAVHADNTHMHFYPHDEFDVDTGLTTEDVKALYAYAHTNNVVFQSDDSNEWNGTFLGWQLSAPYHNIADNVIIRHGQSTGIAYPRYRIWEGDDNTGELIYDHTYLITGNETPYADTTWPLVGHLEFKAGYNYWFEMQSDVSINLMTDAAGTSPYLAADISSIRQDTMLQTAPYVDGGTFTLGQYMIDSRKIYICNTTGVQTGTFEDNSDKWDELGINVEAETDPVFTAWDKDVADLSGMAEHRIARGTASGGLAGDSLLTFDGTDLNIIGTATISNTGQNKFQLMSQGNSAVTIDMWSDNTLKSVVGYHQSDYLVLNHDSTLASKNTDGIIIKNGNVGIGVVPTREFEIQGDSAGSISSMLYNSNVGGIADMMCTNTTSDIHLIANNGPGGFAGVPTGYVGIAAPNCDMYITVESAVVGQFKTTGLDITGDIKADNIFLSDSGTNSISWLTVDGWFRIDGGIDTPHIDCSGDCNADKFTSSTADITDYLMTPLIYNTDGDTVTINDNLDVTGLITAGGGNSDQWNAGMAFTGDIPEIYNSLGNLKIQADAQGDVELFGDTNVGDAENGKMLYIRRQAAEGNNYLRFYISASRTAYAHSNANFTFQAQSKFTINSVDDDIVLGLGDNAGAKKLYIRDSDNITVASIDSLGAGEFTSLNGIILKEDGSDNIFIGEAIPLNIGGNNTSIGSGNMTTMTLNDAHYNVAVGTNLAPTLKGNSDNNVFIGHNIMTALTLASTNNVMIGNHLQFPNCENGSGNTIVGHTLCDNVSSFVDNVVVGYNSVKSATNMDNCVVIGKSAGNSATGGLDNVILLGYNCPVPSGGTTDYMNLGSEIQANLNTHVVTIGRITAKPTHSEKLWVEGDLHVEDEINGAFLHCHTGTISDNIALGEGMPQYVVESSTDFQANIFFGYKNAVNSAGTAGLISGVGNIVIGDTNGQNMDGNSGDHHRNIILGAQCGNVRAIGDYNILIGDNCDAIQGMPDYSLNIGQVIYGEVEGDRIRIGGNDGAALETSAALEIDSTTGALLLPRMTTTQRTALTPVNGMMIYNTTTNKLQGRENGGWVNLI